MNIEHDKNIVIVVFSVLLIGAISMLKADADALLTEKKTELTESWLGIFKDAMPAGWTLKVKDNTVPDRHNNGSMKGVKLSFTGNKMARFAGRYLEHKKTEYFTVWVMPINYSHSSLPVDLRNAGSFTKMPEMLGSNKTHQVYVLTSVVDLPTWEEWKVDIKKTLDLNISMQKHKTYIPKVFSCSAVDECILLGQTETTEGLIYRVRLKPDDQRVYIIRTGDIIGGYEVLGNSSVDGQNIILKKGVHEINLHKSLE
ncbi:MAG: hypothetical protein KAI74_06410 [Kiritimatiellae bacterium]|nr:hypothetical protein [Kiritimatiellia bacterium]